MNKLLYKERVDLLSAEIAKVVFVNIWLAVVRKHGINTDIAIQKPEDKFLLSQWEFCIEECIPLAVKWVEKQAESFKDGIKLNDSTITEEKLIFLAKENGYME